MRANILVGLGLAATLFACVGPEVIDDCGEWSSQLILETFDIDVDQEIHCGSMDESTTEAEAEAILACMNAALEAGDPAVAGFHIHYEDEIYDNINESRVWHVRPAGEEPRIIGSLRFKKTPEEGPDVTTYDVQHCEALGTTMTDNDYLYPPATVHMLSCNSSEWLCP